MNKAYFIENYSSLPSEYLIELRGKGPDLVDQAHEAIEEILKSRGESFPPRPAQAINTPYEQRKTITNTSRAPSTNSVGIRKTLRIAIWIALLFIALFVGQLASGVLKKSGLSVWVGGILIVAFFIYHMMIKNQYLNPIDPMDELRKKVGKNGFTDLMFDTAIGEIARVREFLNYGVNVNDITDGGETALIIASKNGRLDIAQVLLAHGANVKIPTVDGKNAEDYARITGHNEIVELLIKSNN